MNFFSFLLDKVYLKQWSIGIVQLDMQDIIRNKTKNINFTWIALNNNNKFYADPFLFKSGSEEYSILFEEYDYRNQYGKISLFTLTDDFKVRFSKTLIDTNSHLSYPNIFIEENVMYVFPESCKSGKLAAYRYDGNTKTLAYICDIINLPLVDSTILKFNNKYWIFCTMQGEHANKRLYIYYSESLLGPYSPHTENPVKNDIYGSRPAGNFIEVDDHLYRPSQNSGKYYGSSINIHKVIHLSEDRYKEEPYMTIETNKNDHYNFGMHTINHVNDVIVVDGLVRRFLPVTQLTTFIRKHFKRRINKIR